MRGRSCRVVLTPDLEAGGYTVEVPELPGCRTEGDDVAEAKRMAREAVDAWLSVDAPRSRQRTAGDGDGGGVQRSQPEQMLLRGLATPLRRNARSVSDVPPGRLLTVRETARLLRVSTATVYKLCARGELAHVRVLNVIRIPSGAASTLRVRPPAPRS